MRSLISVLNEINVRKFLHHLKGPECPGCDDRLKEGHLYIVSWFKAMKLKYPDMHCSWVYRDRKEQDAAVDRGASHTPWPQSKHNAEDEHGNPQSQAIDIFQIIDAKAVFSKTFCTKVWKDTKNHFRIRWGGDWPRLGDYGHFEMGENRLSDKKELKS